MAKHSKRNRRRMHQAGMGGGFRMVRQVPVRFQRRLPQAAPLSPEAQYRLRCLEHADRTSVREASRAFQVPVSTIYRWRRRFRPDDLTTLEPRSRRPHRTRRATWTAAQESAVLALRQQHPRMGKGPLRVLLAQQGHHLSASMIGRMLGSLRRRTLLREPHTVRVRRERPQRPYATRVPKDKRTPTEPGALVQLDTMHLRPAPRRRTPPVHRHRRRQPLRRGRGPGDGLGGDRDGLSGRAPRPDAGARPGHPGRRGQ